MHNSNRYLSKALKGVNNVLAFPSRLFFIHEMLPFTSSAHTKVRTWRCATVGRSTENFDHFSLLETLLRPRDARADALAWQRTSDEVNESVETSDSNAFEPDGINVDLNFLLWALTTHACLRGMFELQS